MVQPADMTLMRIFIGESDRFEKKPLYEALVEYFKAEGMAGATVIKGAMGYGGHSEVHSNRLLRLSSDLPVVVEVVDSQEKIDLVLPQLEEMLHGGLVTMEKARVIKFGKER